MRIAAPALAAMLAGALVASTAGAVPDQFRPISASQIAASRPPPPPGPRRAGRRRPRPLRARCGSCSWATRWRRAWSPASSPRPRPAITSSGASRCPGCGLSSDVGDHWNGEAWRAIDKRCLPAWRQRWPQQLAQFQPDVVVMLVGAQDTFDRRINGTVVKFDTTEGARLAHARSLRRHHDALERRRPRRGCSPRRTTCRAGR